MTKPCHFQPYPHAGNLIDWPDELLIALGDTPGYFLRTWGSGDVKPVPHDLGLRIEGLCGPAPQADIPPRCNPTAGGLRERATARPRYEERTSSARNRGHGF